MRKRLLLLFICFVTIPIIIIYTVAASIFNYRTEMNLKDIYTNDIKNISRTAENYFAEAIALTMYPLLEPNIYQFFSASSDDPDFAKISENAEAVLKSSPYVFGGLRDVILQRNDGIQLIKRSNYLFNNVLTPSEIETANALNGRCYWQHEEQNSLFSIVRLIKSKYNLTHTLGYVRATISTYELRNVLNNTIIDDDFTYFILDESGRMILSTKDSTQYTDFLSEHSFDTLQTLSAQSVCTKLEDSYFISSQKIAGTPYLICSVIKSDIFTSTKNTLVNILTIVAVITTIFFALLASVFSKMIVKPLTELGNNMIALSDENFAVKIPINEKRNDEITVLTTHFNQMVDKLEYLYKQVYMGEIELKQSQLIALQSQINPHFLYNTMDTIYWMSEMGNTKDVSNIVSNMSRLLRLTFSPNNDDTHLLREELEHLRCYIEIQKIRYGDTVTFELNYDNTMDSFPVLRLLLQPLVENALVHGLKEQAFEHIIIQIYPQDNFIVYKVMNSGSPIDLHLIENILKSENTVTKGFAIRNIDKRLRLKYGDTSGLEYGIEGEFNIFKIKQPIL